MTALIPLTQVGSAVAGAMPAPGRRISEPNLLAELRKSHETLCAAIADLEAIISESRPDRARYPRIRWNVSSASRSRRVLTSRIYAELMKCVSGEEAARLERLMSEDLLMLHKSASHIRTWTVANVATDWLGYREAAAEMLGLMKNRIGSEQAILYPLLEKYDCGSGNRA